MVMTLDTHLDFIARVVASNKIHFRTNKTKNSFFMTWDKWDALGFTTETISEGNNRDLLLTPPPISSNENFTPPPPHAGTNSSLIG